MRCCFALYIWYADTSKLATKDTARTFSQQLFPHLLPTYFSWCTFQISFQVHLGLAAIFFSPPSNSRSIAILGKVVAPMPPGLFHGLFFLRFPQRWCKQAHTEGLYVPIILVQEKILPCWQIPREKSNRSTELQYFCIKKSSILQFHCPFSTSLPFRPLFLSTHLLGRCYTNLWSPRRISRHIFPKRLLMPTFFALCEAMTAQVCLLWLIWFTED